MFHPVNIDDCRYTGQIFFCKLHSRQISPKSLGLDTYTVSCERNHIVSSTSVGEDIFFTPEKRMSEVERVARKWNISGMKGGFGGNVAPVWNMRTYA